MLVGRELELAALDALLDRGGVAVVEGAAGIGKTSLVQECCARARRRGWLVFQGHGSELESGFVFGVVRQLFERSLVSAAAGERAEWLAGPAAAAGDMLLGRAGVVGAPDTSFALLHGLYWLTANLAAGQPVLVAVDDAHWADTASLRWLAYVAGRLDGLAVAVVLALPPANSAGDDAAVSAIRSVASSVRPGLLGEDAVAAIARGVLGPQTSDELCAALRRASGGNPFYLDELLRAARQQPANGQFDAGRLDGPPGDVVTRHVNARIRRLDPDAFRLAGALAVLGDGCQLRHAAAMTGMDIDTASRLAAGLVGVEVLAAGRPPRFLHPIVRAAVESSVAAGGLHAFHRAAADELDRDHGAPGQVAAHLLRVHPAGDPWVVDRLRRAARAAMESGAPTEAGELLRRALAEPPPREHRVDVLRELAAADANAGRQSAVQWLHEALTLTEGPRERAVIAHEVAQSYAALFRWAEAVDVTDLALGELGDRDPELAARLEAELVVAGMHDARRAHRVAPVMGRLLARGASADTEEALAVAGGMASVLTGQPPAAVDRALDDAMRRAPPSAPNWDTRAALLWTSITAERFETVDAVLPAMIAAVHRSGSARGLIATYSSLALLKYRLGALPEADGAARVALQVLSEGDFAAGMGVSATVADVAIESGELDEAQALLDLIPASPPGVVSVLAPSARGRLALARGDGERALGHFEACLAMFGSDLWGLDVRDVAYLHARSGAAQALLLLGERERAADLASSELADARALGRPRALGIALRVAGLASGGSTGIALLTESVGTLRHSPALLERAKSVVELGSALRRVGQRVAARPLLVEALDLAAGCGARPLAHRARAELTAAGARPRRERRHGVAALTPSELRVARLAAAGHTNRHIAHSLYVTPKTVETHLAHTYAKLGIADRGELPDALAEQNLRVPTLTPTEGRSAQSSVTQR